MNKRPEFYVSIISGAKDMPRWLTNDERGTLEEVLCYAQKHDMVILASLAGEALSFITLSLEVAQTFEPALIEAFAVGRATKIVDQARAVKEAIYSLRRPGVDDLITAIEDEIDLPEVLRKAGE